MSAELLTDNEHRAVDMAAELMCLLREIVGDGPTRNQDLAEFAIAIHQLQRGVLKQAAARAYPDRYRLLGEVIPS